MTMPKRIFIADDSPALVEVLAEVFNLAGYEVTTFTDGQAVIESIKESLPEIILVDLNMPYVSGLEVLKFLRQQAGGKQTKAILCTGDSSVRNAPKSHLADVLFTKPIDMDDLLRAVS